LIAVLPSFPARDKQRNRVRCLDAVIGVSTRMKGNGGFYDSRELSFEKLNTDGENGENSGKDEQEENKESPQDSLLRVKGTGFVGILYTASVNNEQAQLMRI
jgi:hypothetical protein